MNTGFSSYLNPLNNAYGSVLRNVRDRIPSFQPQSAYRPPRQSYQPEYQLPPQPAYQPAYQPEYQPPPPSQSEYISTYGPPPPTFQQSTEMNRMPMYSDIPPSKGSSTLAKVAAGIVFLLLVGGVIALIVVLSKKPAKSSTFINPVDDESLDYNNSIDDSPIDKKYNTPEYYKQQGYLDRREVTLTDVSPLSEVQLIRDNNHNFNYKYITQAST